MMTSPTQLYIQDPLTNRIRITKAGIEKYGQRFARAGYSIQTIKTPTEFKNAVDACFALELQQLASTAKGKNADLDNILNGLPGWD